MSQAVGAPNFRATFNYISEHKSDLLEELHSEIDRFVIGKTEFNSQEAAPAVLRKWDRNREWTKLCGGVKQSGQVFGFALCNYLSRSGWEIIPITIKGRPAKLYRRY